MAASKSPILSQIYLPISYAIKEYQFFMILDSLEYTLHVITIQQFGVLCLTSEQRGYAVTAQVKKGKR